MSQSTGKRHPPPSAKRFHLSQKGRKPCKFFMLPPMDNFVSRIKAMASGSRTASAANNAANERLYLAWNLPCRYSANSIFCLFQDHKASINAPSRTPRPSANLRRLISDLRENLLSISSPLTLPADDGHRSHRDFPLPETDSNLYRHPVALRDTLANSDQPTVHRCSF